MDSRTIWLSVALLAGCSSSGQTAVESEAGTGGVPTSTGGTSGKDGSAAAGGTQSSSGGTQQGGSTGGTAPVGDGGEADATGYPCTTDNNCPSGFRCGYLMADGCSAKGVCVQYTCAGTACVHPGGGPCGCDAHPIDYVNAIIGVGNMTLLYTSAPYGGPCFCGVTWCPDAGPA
jgi:hypothetical protein